MPLPSPKGEQGTSRFVSSCMSDPDMVKEFPDSKQRAAVCYSQWKRAKKSKGSLEIDWVEWDLEDNQHFILY